MAFIQDKFRPWLWVPPKLAHDLAPMGLRFASAFYRHRPIPKWKALRWKNLDFANPMGIAGGVDKNAVSAEDWWRLGAGFIEVGTVTPLPQGPNSGTILLRNNKTEALWNKMGFPNQGALSIKKRLQHLFPLRRTPIFLNIGKNRSTPLDIAAKDYVQLVQDFQNLCDVFVVNVSSPNTPGLRSLQSREALQEILSSIKQKNLKSIPVLLKISPDMEPSQLTETLEAAMANQISGFVCTNTTVNRTPDWTLPTEGGVSGRPLADKSRETLRFVLKELGDRRKGLLIISAGGIAGRRDVLERLEMGANLVQVYTALVFKGPWFFRRIAAEGVSS